MSRRQEQNMRHENDLHWQCTKTSGTSGKKYFFYNRAVECDRNGPCAGELKQQLEEELNKLKKDAKLLAKLREALQNIEEQRRKLRETYTQCMTEEKEAAENWQAVRLH